MATPQSTPIKQAKQVKLSIGVSAKSASLTSEYKRLLSDQHQRLSLKHQQDLDLLDDIRSYVKARLSIEKDYTNSLQKLAKQHSNYINKKFVLLAQLDQQQSPAAGGNYDQQNSSHDSDEIRANKLISGSVGSNSGPSSGAIDNMDSRQHNSSSSGCNITINSNKPSSLYKVWSEHINFLQLTSKNRSDQFEQLNLIVDKLKDIRQHKASIGKKCLDQHLKPIQEDLLLSLMDVEKAKKLYYEDESQAKKARENEEKIKKKKGLLTKFTDIQAKREKFSAQREANDIQSTQARNDYIMALAAANAYLKYYYQRDLNDFIHLIDDGVLDHCKIFMATLSECEINWLKYSLAHAQTWSKLINLTGSHQTNNIFLLCEQSKCLRTKQELAFEPCNNDPIQKISLEHNADYALQHEIDKWFTWFKKECRNLSQLMHQLDTYQHAFAEGKKSIEVNGQTIDDLEPKIVNLKQQIRKCEAAKLKAQARLSAIKDGGMQIEEWSDVELEIRADMARAQEEQQQQARRLKEMRDKSMDDSSMVHGGGGGSSSGRRTGGDYCDDPSSSVHDGQYGTDQGRTVIQLQVSKDSDDSDLLARGEGGGESMHNLASVSRSNSNLMQKQRNAMTGYSALTDPSLVWQDDQSAAWGGASATPVAPSNVAVSPHSFNDQSQQPQQQQQQPQQQQQQQQQQHQQQPQLLTDKQKQQQKQIPNTSMSIQSSSPLSAIMNGGQHLSQSPYQGIMSEAYKSDYECDYSRSGQHASIRSAASSAEPTMHQMNRRDQQQFAGSPGDIQERMDESQFEREDGTGCDLANLLNKRVVALYTFDKDNHDDLPFSEGDVLLVIETNPEDRNWVKARHESTGEIGFIPAAYVRPVGADDLGEQREAAAAASSQNDSVAQHDRQLAESNGDWAGEIEPQYKPNEVYRQMTIRTHSRGLCRAKYNYTAEPNMFEEDGYPHLSLKRGEIMAIIDQGEDDGWWLVEKQAKNAPAEEARGHVPSMLVEEVAPGQEHIALAREQNPSDDSDVSDDEDDDADGDDDDEESYDDDGPVKGPPPSFEPPVLKQDQDDDSPTGPQALEQANGGIVEGKLNEHPNDDCDETKRGPANDGGEMAKSDQDEQAAPDSGQGQESSKSTDNNSSLIPTSFIIIEPTPEVESRKFEDNLYKQDDEETGVAGSSVASGTNSSETFDRTKSEAEREKDSQTTAGRDADATDKKQQQHRDQSTRQVVHSRQPSSQVNYSIVNEDFVLEKPTRRPYQHSASNSIDNASSKHHEPTIEEEEDTCQNETNSMSSGQVQSHDGNDGGGDDNDDCRMRTNMPAPPSVVIDSVEAIPRSPDLSFDEEAGGSGGGGGDDGDGDEDESQRSDVSASERKPIKHTNYANVSPILRHHAEEFCKQLIEEAIMLAPGSQIGPSTSSANVSIDGRITCDANEDDYHNDYEQNDGSFDEST